MTLNLLNSPFDEKQTKLLNELYPTLTDYQKVWLTGFLSASQIAVINNQVDETTKEQSQTTQLVQTTTKVATILYGSQTGNAQGVANKLKEALEGINVDVTISAMSDFKTNNLKKLKNLFIVTSTHGEGEPPDNALSFYNFLFSKRAPKLDHLSYSVLALGDSSYELFCKTGIDFDEQLEKLGAKRIVHRVDCDLDYENEADRWISEVLAAISSEESNSSQNLPLQSNEVETKVTYNKNNPYYAEVLESINLNGRGSNKHTQHIELSIEGSGLTYEPGDCVGIIPENDPKLVTDLIRALGFEGNKNVTVKDETLTLEEALRTKLEITVLSKPLLKKIVQFSTNEQFKSLVEDEEAIKSYIYGRDLLDVVEKYGPFTWDEQQFVDQLRKIPVRLYSISSSQKATEDEIHLTIGKVFYEVDGRNRLGVTSGQVTERIQVGDKLPIYIHKNQNFKLPENPETPIIMIGAGTGIAPFRAFLEERAEIGAQGASWLFFGDQHFRTDFLYQTELQRHLKEGTLTKISLAFSRDQEEKIYVQHRLLENAKEVYEWLENGAVLYVCGDEKGMAHGVHEALIQIIKEQGNKSEEEAISYINELKQQKRYQRDVY